MGEHEYLQALQHILDNGEHIPSRTGTDCISVFDVNLSFEVNYWGPNLYQVPILTTKKIYTKGIILELLWFLKGLTNTNWLSERGVHFWDGNTSAETLSKLGLPYEAGELGPGYGHQWINWGGDFRTGKGGINQIEKIIHTLKTNPTDRRIILNAWNVADLDKMALPPCHLMYMFKVTNHNSSNLNNENQQKRVLNCKVILRSNDMFLGSPFNIASASILTCILSQCVGMNPGKVTLSICDAHIYSNHVTQVKEQISRKSQIQMAPILKIKKELNNYEDICALEYSDFELLNYVSCPAIKADMAV